MDREALDYLSTYRLDTPDRLFAEEKVVTRAEAAGEEGIASLARKAQAHDAATFELEQRWRQQERSEARYGPRARELDQKLDRLIGGMKGLLENQARLNEVGDPRREASERLLKVFFPMGLAAVSKGRFTEQYLQLGFLEDKLGADPEAQAALALLGLEESFERVKQLVREYGAELEPPGGRLGFEELKAARARGAALFGDLTIAILARYTVDEDPDFRLRMALLEPIEEQNRRVQAQYKSRMKRGAATESEDPSPASKKPEGPEAEAA